MTKQESKTDGAIEQTLAAWLTGLHFGEPIADRGLALTPLYTRSRPGIAAYRLLAAAIALGEVTVQEAAQAAVPALRLTNTGDLPVLILGGEEVVGGRQHRVVNTSLLAPARSVFDLPVSCVEQGRWSQTTVTFGVGETAYPLLRGKMLEQVSSGYAQLRSPATDQAAIWAEVAARQQSVGARSATGAMRDAYAAREDDLARAEERLHYPDDGPVGVLALIGGHAACADIFDQPETLRGCWPRLVRSYALEALGAATTARPSLDSALRLLQRARAAPRHVYASPALGHDVRLAGNGMQGAALVCAGVVVHTSLIRRQHAG